MHTLQEKPNERTGALQRMQRQRTNPGKKAVRRPKSQQTVHKMPKTAPKQEIYPLQGMQEETERKQQKLLSTPAFEGELHRLRRPAATKSPIRQLPRL